jgi:putative flippase GtrA
LSSILFKFFKFALVGSSGLIIDFGTTYLLKEKIKINKFIANATGFSLAASSNYLWNRLWTFHSNNPEIFFEYLSFIIISLIGLGINTVVLWLLIRKSKRNFYLAKVFATLVTVIWNFSANFLFTFNMQFFNF